MSNSGNILPKPLPLVFTPKTSLYENEVSCIYNNDSFTEFLNEDYDSYVITPWAWKQSDSPRVIDLVLPAIAVVTLAMNVVAVATFVKENMVSPINVVLIAIAVSDTLSVFIPSVAIVTLYFDGVIPDYIPYQYCQIWGYFTKYLPTITHNASVWLTLVLATKRYLIVCRPFLARRYCTHRASLKAISAVYLLALLSNACRFVDTDYVPVKIVSDSMAADTGSSYALRNSSSTGFPFLENSNNNNTRDLCNAPEGIITCRAVYAEWLQGRGKLYEYCYYWFVIIFVKFVPCSCLIVLDTLMLRGLKTSETFRHQLGYNSQRNTYDVKSKHKESRRVTLMIVGIIIVVVMVELPVGVILVFWTLSTIHGRPMISESVLSQISRIANVLIYVSYPAIFMTYCCMCERFRLAFVRIFKCGNSSRNVAVPLAVNSFRVAGSRVTQI